MARICLLDHSRRAFVVLTDGGSAPQICPHALVAARLAAEYAIGVGHSRFGAYPYMIRLLGLTREEVHRYSDQARREDRRAMPGAVRASAGINISDDDVRRLLAAVASIAAGDLPVRYHQDPRPATSSRQRAHSRIGYHEPVRDKWSFPEG